MKRKKFIKMLLSRRVPRNVATALADYAQALHVSYTTALGDFLNLCSIRAFNTWEGKAMVWQKAENNIWVEVLTCE